MNGVSLAGAGLLFEECCGSLGMHIWLSIGVVAIEVVVDDLVVEQRIVRDVESADKMWL